MIKKFILLTIVSVLAACAKDRNADDYRKERTRQSVAEMKAAEGSYTGYLTSRKDGSRMGALQLVLEAGTQPVGSNDGSKPDGTPVLKATLTFESSVRLSISGQNSLYDTETGQFQTEIPVNRQGRVFHVQVNGLLKDGQLRGSLEVTGYRDEGADFALTRGGQALSVLAQQGQPFPSVLFVNGNFAGHTTFQNDVVRGVDLNLLKPAASSGSTASEEEFLNLLMPVKSVIATLNYGGGARITFNNAEWDQRTGLLTGTTALNNAVGTPQLSLNCRFSEGSKGFECEHAVSVVSGIVARTRVVAGRPTQSDTGASRDPVMRTYHGHGEFVAGQPRAVTLSVVEPARTRLDEITDLFVPRIEKTVQAALLNSLAGVPVTFDVKWDAVNSTLDGGRTLTIGGTPVNVWLSCKNFTFQAGAYNFTCNYFSTMRNENVTLRFASR